MYSDDKLVLGLAQISPVWLDRDATLDKIVTTIESVNAVDLIAFGEALLPGYPFWLGLTGGAEFNSLCQKRIHAHYMNNAINIENGDLKPVCEIAKKKNVAIYLGLVERAPDRGGHSLYCSLCYINQQGQLGSIHRKLMPTYEERLTWSPGDGHGLRVHSLGAFTVGGLNCWENWMPLPRAALYGLGEDLHVAIWPGSYRNTHDITQFMAKEGRSYVMSVSAIMRPSDFPAETPDRELILKNNKQEFLCDGGSCLAAPDGSWVIEPQRYQEGVFIAEIDHKKVKQERQNFDPAGHYSRPDVTQLTVNRARQSTIKVIDC